MTTYKIGDLVFAKIKGSRQWPAKIVEIIEKENKQTKYNIVFFGDGKNAVVKHINLAPYLENILTFGTPLTENFKNKNFNLALKEAQTYFNTRGIEANTLETDTNITLNQCANSISDIQDTIKNLNEEPDVNTSLILAAEAGSVLLAENNTLRIELQNKILENAKLAQRILDLSNTNHSIQQDQIEALENENKTLLNRVNDLVQALDEAERQLDMERQLRNQLSATFEEHDNEKEEAIKKYEKTIKEQNKLIENITTYNRTQPSIPLKITTKDSETQTNNAGQIIEIIDSKSNLLVELECLKIRLGVVEDLISTLQSQQNTEVRTDNQESCNIAHTLIHGVSQTRRKKLKKLPFTVTDNLTPGASQTSRKKLNNFSFTVTESSDTDNLTPGDSKTRSNKLNHLSNTSINATRVYSKRNHVRSVSLQAAKYRATSKSIANPSSVALTKNGPPETAKLLGNNESFEDFYMKHIDEAMIQRPLYNNFLEHSSTRKSRFKTVPNQK